MNLSFLKYILRFVLAVAAESPGCYELSQLMTDHVLSHVDRYMAATVMDSDCMANHLREYS